ncbi:MAG TPA: thiamine phosphate synthase [Aquifex aeolicus]|uniref:Thiamine phosphate synthase n=1 Tax=Aquifex aeolicus TaxID=63363 RepID=A0A7C5Q9T6_AQUAO|nr:thiamine phosphate synthase [Aquifex aeolicus]
MRTLPRLYAITDRRKFRAGFTTALEGILRRNVKMIQLREKDLGGRELYSLARQARELTEQYGALLLINERLDIAVAVGADGVHLPEKGLPPGVVKDLFPHLLVGYSAHSLEGVLYAQKEGADFVTLSPIFRTESHPEAEPLGLEELKRVSAKVNVPIYALGGVTQERIELCLKNGAYGVAGITMFLDGEDEGPDSGGSP